MRMDFTLVTSLLCLATVVLGRQTRDAVSPQSLAATLQQLEQKVSSLEAELDGVKDSNARQQRQIVGLISNQTGLSTVLHEWERNVEDDLLSARRRVSFSAKMSAREVRRGRLPFEHVISNQGGHYDPETSTFTCPVPGNYFFHFSVYARLIASGGRARRAAVRLLVAGDEVMWAQSHTEDDQHGDSRQVASAAVVSCPAGALVTVRYRRG